MKILPPATRPWSERIIRSHVPQPATAAKGYRAYRSCLRWEFGFCCAFCLVHEVDLGLATGRSLMETEHFIPVKYRPDLENDYLNCFHCCHFCNHRRGIQPNSGPFGERLLNPCDNIWEEYFVLEEDVIHPREEYRDAVYTHDVYDLNDPRKVRMRWLRREVIEDCLELLRDGEFLSKRLLQDGTDPESLSEANPELNASRIDKSRELWKKFKKAVQQLQWYNVVPWDADRACVCEGTGSSSLPKVVTEQTIEFNPSSQF